MTFKSMQYPNQLHKCNLIKNWLNQYSANSYDFWWCHQKQKILVLDRNAHNIAGRQHYHSILALHIPVKLFELNSNEWHKLFMTKILQKLSKMSNRKTLIWMKQMIFNIAVDFFLWFWWSNIKWLGNQCLYVRFHSWFWSPELLD